MRQMHDYFLNESLPLVQSVNNGFRVIRVTRVMVKNARMFTSNMELSQDVLCELLTISRWNRDTASAIINKTHNEVFSSSQLSYAQYCLLLHAANQDNENKNASVYTVLSDALKSCCPDFLPPKYWSDCTRRANKNVQSMKNLENPVFSSSADSLGPCSEKLGITKTNLNEIQTSHPFSVGAFVELCRFKNKKKICWDEIKTFVYRINPSDIKVTVCHQKLQHVFNKASTKMSQLSKNKLKFELERLKATDFFSYLMEPNTKSCFPSSKHKRVPSEMKQLLKLSREAVKENQSLLTENEALYEKIKTQNSDINTLTVNLNKSNSAVKKLTPLKKENEDFKNQIGELKKNVTSLKKSNYVKRLKREKKKDLDKIELQRRKIHKLKNKVSISKTVNRNLSEQIIQKNERIASAQQQSVKKIKKFRSQVDYWKNIGKKKIQALQEKNVENENLKQEVIGLQKEEINVNAVDNQIVTKYNNRYSDDLRVCALDLQSLDVPCNKISNVIQSVGQNIFHQKVQVPSRSTLQNIVDEGLVISKSHVAEKLKTTSNWGIFSDGTSRDGKKIVDIGVHTDNSTLSLGYKTVATEDSEAVSEVIKNSIKDTASYVTNMGDNSLTHFLTSLSSLMSDRSSVMKKSNEILQEWRNLELSKTLQPGEMKTLDFLYCSAHVLLGFHSKIEKDLEQFEKKSNQQFGRDKNVKFKNFMNNEPSSFRLIRTASECFGPRGDQKNGARQSWLTYLNIKSKKSHMISYRSNRFNNLFLGALSIVFHKDDITDFLKNYCKDPNRKLQSILCDIECEEVFKQVLALAIIGSKITMPYWDLVNSSEHHLDLYKFFQPLHSKLEAWVLDSTEITLAGTTPIFDKFPHTEYPVLNQFVTQYENDVKILVSLFCDSLSKVMEKQLCDYLNEGKYSKEPTDENRQKLSHSKLTNIPGENLFGDLDFSIQRKRNATFRHHSAISMLKRNKTVAWLRKKSAEARATLLKDATVKSIVVRKKEQKYEKEIKQKRKQILQSIKLKKEQLQLKKSQEIQRIEKSVRSMGGIVKSLRDLDHLLSSSKNCKLKKSCVRDQLLYLKNFMNKDIDRKLTFMSQTLKNLKQNLINVLELDSTPELVPGLWVAVAYQEAWYPGEIINISPDKEIEVNFLRPKKLGGTSFIWPSPPDVKKIDEKFIFFRNLTVVPTPGLRFWVIHEFDDIDESYTEYCEKYF